MLHPEGLKFHPTVDANVSESIHSRAGPQDEKVLMRDQFKVEEVFHILTVSSQEHVAT